MDLPLRAMQWTPFVLIRYVSYLIGGILLGIYFPANFSFGNLFLGLAIVACAYGITVFYSRDGYIKLIAGIAGGIFLVGAGYALVAVRTDTHYTNHLIYQSDSVNYYTVTINSYPKASERVWKVEGIVTAVKQKDTWEKRYGKILLYVEKTENPFPYRYGDQLLVKGIPRAVPGPMNPHAFDYKQFLSFKNIYHQDFLKEKRTITIGQHVPNRLLALGFSLRGWATKQLHIYVSGAQQQALVCALVLGVTDELSDDLLKAYATSGAMHVLAVSGLHVGILYGLLLFLLRPLKRSSYGKWITVFISIFVIWCYALLTGFSPSVLRAVTMLSFVAVGRLLERQTNIYNTLGLAAFCLLLYNPYFIMSVGFQLSFLAVFGIVYLFPRIYFFWTPPNAFANVVWKITAVSIAAQLATCSLSLLYFHQFPVYFLVSNLFVIPGAFAIVVLGLAIIATSFVSPVALLLGKLLTAIIKVLNTVIYFINDLPYSKIEDVYLTTAQCWYLMGILVMILLLLEFKRIYFLHAAFALTLLFSFIQWQGYRKSREAVKFTVYAINGHSAFDFTSRGRVYFLADSALVNTPDLVHFHVANGRLVNFVNGVSTSSSAFPFVRNFKGCRLILWHNHTVLQILEKEFMFSHNFKVNFLVISNDAVRKWSDIEGKVDFGTAIVDGSNSFYTAQNLLTEHADQITVHSIRHAGYFEEVIDAL